MVNVRIASEAWICWSFVQPSDARFWTWASIWSWDPLGCATLSAAPPQPRPGKNPAGQDPKAGLGRSKSRQQRSDQTRKPVKSEQHSCSSTAQAGYGFRMFYKHIGRSNPLCSASESPKLQEKISLAELCRDVRRLTAVVAQAGH